MAKAHLHGTPPVRSLAMNYPQDVSARSIDRQFMWGQDLMVVPVLEKKSMYNLYLGWGEGYPEFSWDFVGDMRQAIQAYFPKDSWYDWWDTDRLGHNNSHFFFQCKNVELAQNLKGEK